MKMFNPIFAAMLALAACQNSQYEDSDTQIDRGTEILVPNGVSLVPKSAKVDAKGRWTLTKAPPLDSNVLVRTEKLQPIDGRGHFELFYEIPLSPSEQAKIRRASPVVTLDMPPRYRTTLIIDQGCFRLDEKDRPLVRFSAQPEIGMDTDGYLTIGFSGARGYSRIGEPVEWPNGWAKANGGGNGLKEITDPAALAPIRAACGEGRVVEVPMSLQSTGLLLEQARADAVQNYSRQYGGTLEDAQKQIGNCGIEYPCLLPPPPPVPDAKDCPKGTTWQGYLCRTPEGFIRPVP